MLEALSLGTILFYLYLAVVGITGLMTFVLFYHWVRYNPGVLSTVLVMAVYSVGTIGLLMSAFAILPQI